MTSISKPENPFAAEPSTASRSPLDEPANERTVFDLHAAGLLSDAARDEALAILRPAHHWWRWADRALLFVGATLALAGIVFFFAYNWARMGAVAKFAVIEAALWACAIGAMRKGLETLPGKVLLLAASMLVGVLLAVYGQVYQTGADAFEIYAAWAALILPWVVLGEFAALWALWLGVANAALILFWDQVEPLQGLGFHGRFLLPAALNRLALAACESDAARRRLGGEGLWLRRLTWLSVLVYLLIPALDFIVEYEFRDLEVKVRDASLLGAAALAGTLPAGYFYYRRRAPDMTCLALAVIAACVAVLTIVANVLFEISDDEPALVAFGLIVLGVTAAATLHLRRLTKEVGALL